MSSAGAVPGTRFAPIEALEPTVVEPSSYCVIYSDSNGGRHRVLATRTADPENARKVVEAAKSEGFLQVQHSPFVVGGLRLQFAKQVPGALETLTVDLIDSRSLLFASFDDVLGRSERLRNAAPRDEFLFLLACSVRGILLTQEQRERLKRLSCTDGDDPPQSAIRHLLGRSALPDPVAFPRHFDRLRYWGKIALRRPIALAVHAASELARRLRLFLNPPGLFIVILGPDGAGKSTSKNALIDQLSAVFPRILSWHWRPGFVWRVGPATPFRRPHSKRPRSQLMSMFYLTAVFADAWVGYLQAGRRILMSGGLLTCDRYFRDVLVDPLRYRFSGPRWFPRLLARFVPKPDLVIVLDAEEGIMFDRKPELSLEELRRQRLGYAQLADVLPNVRLVRADVSIEQTSRNVIGHVIEFLSSRIAS